MQAIRAARLQEMQRNSQGGGGSTRSNGGPAGGADAAASGVNDAILDRILDLEAKQRLNRVRMVKPDRVLGVENYLVRLYQGGGIRSKLTEADIVDILDKIAQEERRNTTTRIKFERREYTDGALGGNGANDGSDSEDDFFDE